MFALPPLTARSCNKQGRVPQSCGPARTPCTMLGQCTQPPAAASCWLQLAAAARPLGAAAHTRPGASGATGCARQACHHTPAPWKCSKSPLHVTPTPPTKPLTFLKCKEATPRRGQGMRHCLKATEMLPAPDTAMPRPPASLAHNHSLPSPHQLHFTRPAWLAVLPASAKARCNSCAPSPTTFQRLHTLPAAPPLMAE